MPAPQIEAIEPGLWRGQFHAMASTCEVWLEGSQSQVTPLMRWATTETLRIEQTYSRFHPSSSLSQLNANHTWQVVDTEMATLLQLADQAWQLSDGLIDITVLPLQTLWRFDHGSHPPSDRAIQQALAQVGWQKVQWHPQQRQLKLPAGMALDLGGIGKEYAVDKVAKTLQNMTAESIANHPGGVMVNFGGDLVVARDRQNGQGFCVGLESPKDTSQIAHQMILHQGALATSGNGKRFIQAPNGQRWGHIVNPRTGYPTPNAPASVSVIGSSCTQAGLLATLAMLKGETAQDWLAEQHIEAVCQFWSDKITP